MAKANGTAPEKPTILCELTITNHDIENLIAFGNRAQMTGLEAGLWIELRSNLVGVLEQAHAAPDSGADLIVPPDLSPGGTD
jgi:hypothetical protein